SLIKSQRIIAIIIPGTDITKNDTCQENFTARNVANNGVNVAPINCADPCTIPALTPRRPGVDSFLIVACAMGSTGPSEIPIIVRAITSVAKFLAKPERIVQKENTNVAGTKTFLLDPIKSDTELNI